MGRLPDSDTCAWFCIVHGVKIIGSRPQRNPQNLRMWFRWLSVVCQVSAKQHVREYLFFFRRLRWRCVVPSGTLRAMKQPAMMKSMPSEPSHSDSRIVLKVEVPRSVKSLMDLYKRAGVNNNVIVGIALETFADLTDEEQVARIFVRVRSDMVAWRREAFARKEARELREYERAVESGEIPPIDTSLRLTPGNSPSGPGEDPSGVRRVLWPLSYPPASPGRLAIAR